MDIPDNRVMRIRNNTRNQAGMRRRINKITIGNPAGNITDIRRMVNNRPTRDIRRISTIMVIMVMIPIPITATIHRNRTHPLRRRRTGYPIIPILSCGLWIPVA